LSVSVVSASFQQEKVTGHRDCRPTYLACQPVKLVTRKSRRGTVNQLTKINTLLPRDKIPIGLINHNIQLTCFIL